MGSEKQTSINLTKKGQKLKEKYKGFNLKGLFSVALELFDRLPAKDKIERIQKVLDEDNKRKKKK